MVSTLYWGLELSQKFICDFRNYKNSYNLLLSNSNIGTPTLSKLMDDGRFLEKRLDFPHGGILYCIF